MFFIVNTATGKSATENMKNKENENKEIT